MRRLALAAVLAAFALATPACAGPDPSMGGRNELSDKWYKRALASYTQGDLDDARAALAGVGLSAVEPRGAASTLSGGEQTRVALAGLLLGSPDLILLDEPTVGLDIASRAEIIRTVRRLVREEGVSVLWATHLIDEIEDEDRVVVLHRGQVLAEGGCRDVIEAEGAGSIGEAFARLTALAPVQAARAP